MLGSDEAKSDGSYVDPAGVVALPNAGVPADRGLASLGLVMQLAGRTAAALTVLVAAIALLHGRPHHHHGWFWVAIALCFARAQLHRRAGRDLAGPRTDAAGVPVNPTDALHTYIVLGLGQACLLGFGGAVSAGARPGTAAGIALALALWPITLAIALRRVRRAYAIGIPPSEDRGLEASSILLAVIGACSMVATIGILVVVSELPRHLPKGRDVLLIALFGALLARSWSHLRAGVAGLRAAAIGEPPPISGNVVFDLLGTVCGFAALALLALTWRLPPDATVALIVLTWLLVMWPAIATRYIDRQRSSEVFDGDRVIHRRGPDAGLCGLGWLLAGHAVLTAMLLTIAATVQPGGPGQALADGMALLGPVIGRSPGDYALVAAVLVLELFAAGALIRMSDHRRLFATMYAPVAAAAALALAWPMLHGLPEHGDLRTMIQMIPTALQLVLPLATLVLARRALVPTAQARFTSIRRSAAK